MQSPPETTPLPLARIIFVGAIVPALFALVDQWLCDQSMGSAGKREAAAALAMSMFVLELGTLSVLCGKRIESPWLRWVIYAWCLLLIDLSATSFFETPAMEMLSSSLAAAQLGLVTVWVVLGIKRWTIGMCFTLILTPLLCSGASFVVQTAVLCLICGALRAQRFRLMLGCLGSSEARPSNAGVELRNAPAMPATVITVSDSGAAPLRVQFSVRDVLIWTTSLAAVSAVARGGAWMKLTEGLLDAIVLVVALWAALGEGPAWLRWPLLLLVALAAGSALAILDWNTINWWFPKGPFWSQRHWQYLRDQQWALFASFFLAGGMLAAALLIFRTLGYRLCREQPPRVANRIGA